jgi:hypothetical protein
MSLTRAATFALPLLTVFHLLQFHRAFLTKIKVTPLNIISESNIFGGSFKQQKQKVP